MNHLAIAPILLPLLMAISLLLLGKQRIRLMRTLSLAAVVFLLVTAIALLKAVAGGEYLVYALGNWQPPFGIVLVADRLAAWMVLITALLALFALLYASRGTDTAGRHFHILFQLQLFGLNGAFLTGDLFNLFVFFEILLLASYGLLLHGGGPLRTRAGLHFVVINLAGSTLFLFAVGTFYGVLGTLNMADIAQKLAQVDAAQQGLVQTAGLLLFGVFALKAAVIPLHLWLPAAYAHTSAPVAALFAIMTKVGAYSILRMQTLFYGAEAGPVANLIDEWLLPLALTTMALGMLGVVASTALRQQVAYLIVASVGSLLTAFGLGNSAGIAAGLYYLPHTCFASAALFLLADSIATRRGSILDRFEAEAYLPDRVILGSLFFVSAVLIAGLPPLSGFLGKFFTLRAALEHAAMPWVVGVVLVTSLLGVIALARAGSILFYRSQPVPGTAQGPGLFTELGPIGALLLLCLGLVIWAGPAHEFVQATANQLLHPQGYFQAVLGNGGTP